MASLPNASRLWGFRAFSLLCGKTLVSVALELGTAMNSTSSQAFKVLPWNANRFYLLSALFRVVMHTHQINQQNEIAVRDGDCYASMPDCTIANDIATSPCSSGSRVPVSSETSK